MSEYIDRNELLKAINENVAEAHNERCAQILEAILNAPTTDVVEVRHGEWNDSIIGFCNVCMECSAIVERTAIKNNSGKLNYCPNCGAKIVGIREKNDA